MSKKLAIETQIARGDHGLDAGILALGPLSPYTCPECHGVLVQLQDGDFTRFRCHTGHAYSPSSLLAEVTQSLEHSWLFVSFDTDGEVVLAGTSRLTNRVYKHMLPLNRACFRLRNQYLFW